MELRFIIRDGKRILQQGRFIAENYDSPFELKWEDVPLHTTEEKETNQ